MRSPDLPPDRYPPHKRVPLAHQIRIPAMQLVLPVLALVAGGYAALTSLMYVFQERIVFQPSARLVGDPSHIGLDYEDVRLHTEDDERLHGWWVPRTAARGTILFFHGNAGNISGRLETIRMLHGLEMNVLIIDYRGYGESTGVPTEQGLYRDAEAAWKHLISERGIDTSRIVIHGRSLGGGPSVWLAERVTAGALILEATFTSVPDAGAHHYPYLPVRLLARVKFDNLAGLGRCRTPLLVVHSEEDLVVPYAHGRRLFTAASEPKEFLALSGGHANAFMGSNEAYASTLDRFLHRTLETEPRN